MNTLTKFSKNFRSDEDGGTSAEYALLAVLIAVVVIFVVATLGAKTVDSFCLFIEKLNGSCS